MPGSTEAASRLNFNPDWMSGGGNNSTGGKNAKFPFYSTSAPSSNQTNNNNNNDTILAPPKLSKNRYSREELLVMFNLSAPAPSRLKGDFVDFYVDPAQNPVCMTPYTDTEQQLLVHGINSSKAMSKVDRCGGGPAHPPPNVGVGGGPPTTNSRWSNLHSSGPNRGFGRGSGVDSFGGGNSAARQNRGFGSSGSADRNVLLTGIGRGRVVDTRLGPATPPTRPGENASLQLNPRAQGLYDLNNPKDRPRQRLKSKTDENDDVVHGGAAKQHHYVAAAAQHNQVQQSASTGGGLPEWIEEDDDYSSIDHNKKQSLIKTGSFDETGNFRREATDQVVSGEKEQPTTTRRLPQTFSASIKGKVDDQPISTKVDMPAPPSLVETNSSKKTSSSAAAEEQPRFLQFLKTPSANQQQETPPSSSGPQRSAENMRLLKTPGSSTTNSKTEDDVLSDLHTRAEGMIKSVFTEESESVVSSKFNRLLIGSSGQQLPIIPLPQVELSTIPLPSLPLPLAPVVALDPQRKVFLDSTWYYKDPSDTCQGPFSSEMMANWFAAGYFTMQLMIRPIFEPNFTSLGDMIKRVGGIPFQQLSPATNTAAATPDAYANFSTAQKTSGFSSSCNTGANLDIFPQPSLNNSIPGQQPSTIWDVYNNSGTNYGLNPVNKQNENIVTSVDNCVNNNVIQKESSLLTKETIERDLQKMLERLKSEDKKRQNEEAERQQALQAEMARMLAEERKKMLELQLKLEREAQEKERLLKEAEAKLKAQLAMQQQVDESAWNKEQKTNQNQNPPNVWGQKQMTLGNLDAPVRSTDVEAWLQSAPQSTGASQNNKVDKKAAKIQKEEERRQKLEQEEQLRRENEEKIKEEQRIATDAKMKAEEAERKRIYKEHVEKELKEQHRRLLEEERRKNKKIVPGNDGGSAWGASVNNQGRPSGGAGSAANRQSTLRDIQIEEERQMMAERRQNMEQELLNKPASPVQQSGAWGRGGGVYASSPTPVIFRENVAPAITTDRTTASKNAWSAGDANFKSPLNISGDSSDDQQRNDVENLFQADESRVRRKSPMKPMTFENKLHKRQEKSNSAQQSKNSAVKKSQTETTKSSNDAIKRLLTQPNDEFAVWCIEQMKKLNKEIADSEASVFIEFLRNVPDLEVKDYVLGYVLETPATNKFLSDFIEKRTRLRISGSTNASLHEWSTVNKQNHGNNDQQHNSNNNNDNKSAVQSKKKGKKGGGGAVLDHAILGFKATGDPNRVNVGEIDSPM